MPGTAIAPETSDGSATDPVRVGGESAPDERVTDTAAGTGSVAALDAEA